MCLLLIQLWDGLGYGRELAIALSPWRLLGVPCVVAAAMMDESSHLHPGCRSLFHGPVSDNEPSIHCKAKASVIGASISVFSPLFLIR